MPKDELGVDELGSWDALTVAEVAELFRGAAFPWWIAGGWAIDLSIGRVTRPHADVEIALLRRDQFSLSDRLPSWELWYAPGPGQGLIRWRASEPLAPDVHEIWCRQRADGPWQLEVLVEEASEDRWEYRRDRRVSLPLARFGTAVGGIPVIRPEIALLYKSKRPRERDEADLVAALPLLDAPSRAWLAAALDITGAGWAATLRCIATD